MERRKARRFFSLGAERSSRSHIKRGCHIKKEEIFLRGDTERIYYSLGDFFLGGDRDIKQGSSKEDGGRLFFGSRDLREKRSFLREH